MATPQPEDKQSVIELLDKEIPFSPLHEWYNHVFNSLLDRLTAKGGSIQSDVSLCQNLAKHPNERLRSLAGGLFIRIHTMNKALKFNQTKLVITLLSGKYPHTFVTLSPTHSQETLIKEMIQGAEKSPQLKEALQNLTQNGFNFSKEPDTPETLRLRTSFITTVLPLFLKNATETQNRNRCRVGIGAGT